MNTKTKQECNELFAVITNHGFAKTVAVLIASFVAIVVLCPVFVIMDLTAAGIAVLILGLIGLLTSLICIIIYAVNRGKFYKICNMGYYDGIYQEYDKPVMSFNKNCKLSNRFLFGGCGAVLPLHRVIWAYCHIETYRVYGIPVNKQRSFMMVTQDNKRLLVPLQKKNMEQQADEILQIVARNNPNLLVGYTNETCQIAQNYFDQQKAIAKQNKKR